VKRDEADPGVNRHAALDVTLARSEHPTCNDFVLRSCALAHRPTVLCCLARQHSIIVRASLT
jgi:hypothetical protein